jgi:AcrR family transcriptional regulator
VDALTDVALEVFRQRGFDGASITDIARAAGLTKSSLYHHVAGKEELLERGLDRALDALFAILDEEEAVSGRPIDRLAHVIRRAVEVEVQLLPEVIVLLRARGNTTTERRAVTRRREFDARVTRLVEDAQRAGELRSDIEPALLTRLVFGMANGLTDWYRPDAAVRPAALVAAIETVLFDGIHAPP